MQPRISFVVPVRNDAVRLERCLRAIKAAAGETPVEIVVVDNGSVDASPSVAARLGATVAVIEQVKVSELRNRGAGLAAADLLAFVDADNEIATGWIDAALSTLDRPDVGACGALYVAPPQGSWVQRAYGLLRGKTTALGKVDWLGSGNLAVRRQAFERIGGFDAALEACEDVDLCNRLRAAGITLIGDPRMESIHHGDPRSLRDLFRSELWRGRDNLRVSLRRPIHLRSIPSAILPVADAALLLVFAASLLAWFSGWSAGLTVALFSLAAIAMGVLLKVARSIAREPAARVSDLAALFLATCVYDLARATALFRQAPHRNAGVPAAPPSPVQ